MSTPLLSTSKWTPIGPAPIDTQGGLDQISGRIQAAATDPTNPATIYLGSDNGGIWKNINSPSWTPLTDAMPSPALGANFGQSFGAYHTLVVHPANPDLVLGLVSGLGAGILQSNDGGNTWQLLANSQFNGKGLNSLAVHPTVPKTMYLSAGGFGAWTSNDGGVTWLGLGNLPSGNVSDLIIAKFNSNILYAAVVGNTGAAQAQNGVYQSIDNGVTWNLLSGLPSGAALGGANITGAVRLESGSAAGIVYASMLVVGANPSPPPALAITAVQRFRTNDGGATWTVLNPTPGKLESRSWHLLLGVDPADGNHVFVNDSYSLYESFDGGNTWSRADAGIGYLKRINSFDWVNLTFDANGEAVLTADQGVLRYDPATKSWTSLIGDLQVSEFYTISLDPQTAAVAYAVGQDIFSEKFTGQTVWNVMESGINETGKIIVDPKNSNQLYAFNPLDTNNFVMQSPDGGVTWTNIFPSSLLSASFLNSYGSGYGFAYASQKAFAIDPSNPTRLLAVADQVFETTNAGSASPTWSPISGVLSQDPANPFVIALAIAPSDVNTVYASTQDGRVWVTYNDGGKWAEWDSGISGQVVDLRIDPADRNQVFALTSRGLWHLPTSGLPWLNITGNLPGNVTYYSLFVVWQSPIPALLVGTDRGVYRSFDLGNTWTNWSPELPNTRVNELQGEMIGGELILAAATVGRGAWEILIQPWGAVATSMADDGNFGNVCLGSFADELLTIDNNGWGSLLISDIISSDLEFEPPSVLSYPLLVNAGYSIDVVIRFAPSSPGFKSATLTVISNDPSGPHKISVSGEGQTSRLSLVIADKGNFGKVCVDSFVDQPLILNNSSRCALSITAISSSSSEFLVPEVLFFPLAIGAGDSLSIPFRFEPTSPGNKSATVTVTSSDPASPHKIRVSGDAETSRLSLMIADTGHFGKVCIGSFKDEPLILNNSSHCPLTIGGITSSSAEFLVPQVLSYPLVVAGGNFLPVPIRFRPTSFGLKSAHITVDSSDPASPHTITVEGEVPSGRLTITGSTIFGGVKCCHREQRTVTICNTGDCHLHVSHVGFKRKRRHFRLINNPFPSTLQPGSCLNVVIQYKASERVSRSCELVIHSDDPHHPVRHLDVIAYTIWDCCKECCEPAKCGCQEQRKECCDNGDNGDDDEGDDDRREEDHDDEV